MLRQVRPILLIVNVSSGTFFRHMLRDEILKLNQPLGPIVTAVLGADFHRNRSLTGRSDQIIGVVPTLQRRPVFDDALE